MFYYFEHGDTGLALDNEDLLNNLINDLYTAEIVSGMKTFTRLLSLGIDRSTSVTAWVNVPAGSFLYTPTKANMLITCKNAIVVNTTGNITEIGVRFDGVDGVEHGYGRMAGTVERQLSASARFEGVVVGVELQIGLYFKVGGGTGTIRSSSELVWDVWEYDS